MLNLTEVELVLDPFMGSGTVGRVCDKLGRSFVGYDLKEFLIIYSYKSPTSIFPVETYVD